MTHGGMPDVYFPPIGLKPPTSVGKEFNRAPQALKNTEPFDFSRRRFSNASVIVAILNDEADAAHLIERIEEASGPKFVSPVVRFEAITSLARARSGAYKTPSADDLVNQTGFIGDDLVPIMRRE